MFQIFTVNTYSSINNLYFYNLRLIFYLDYHTIILLSIFECIGEQIEKNFLQLFCIKPTIYFWFIATELILDLFVRSILLERQKYLVNK